MKAFLRKNRVEGVTTKPVSTRAKSDRTGGQNIDGTISRELAFPPSMTVTNEIQNDNKKSSTKDKSSLNEANKAILEIDGSTI